MHPLCRAEFTPDGAKGAYRSPQTVKLGKYRGILAVF